MTSTDHLDDDAISAVLDGEETGDESRHIDGCETCSARLADLRDASMLVRSPVPPADDARREASIAAALAAAGTASAATVVPLRRRVPPTWLAAAAGVLAVAAAVTLFPRDADRDDAATGGSDAPQSFDEDTALRDDAAILAAPATHDGGDIGEVTDLDLQATIRDALLSAARSSVARDGGGDRAAESGPANGAAAIPACEETVTAGNPALGVPVYRALGTFEGDPVVIYAYDVPTEDRVERWVYVVAVEGCGIRNQQTFEA